MEDVSALMRVLITAVPFGEIDSAPLRLLKEAGLVCMTNPYGRQLSEDEVAELIAPADVVIVGTEPLTARVMDVAPRLRMISRVGIGLDKPWYWNIMLDDLDTRHHGMHAGIWTFHQSVRGGAVPPGVSPAEREWLEEKYPGWEDTWGTHFCTRRSFT